LVYIVYLYYNAWCKKHKIKFFRSEETKIWSSAPKEFQYQDRRTDGMTGTQT